MDREVILRCGEEEIPLGYVSEFLSPQSRDDVFNWLATEVFEKIREAIIDLDLYTAETKPVLISIM